MPEATAGSGDRSTAVLFDLDGTLVDTAPDMAYALNVLLARSNCPPLPFAVIRPHVSHGAKALIRLGFGLDAGDPGFDAHRRAFLDIYAENLVRDTAPFPGMPELLETLESRAIPWGIVTNKPAWLTEPLMATLGLADRAACIVSGDTVERAKPHPDPLLHACRQVERHPSRCWYVGDAERDIAAGRAAGMNTLVALFGYLGEEDPSGWGAHGLIAEPLDVLQWLGPAPT